MSRRLNGYINLDKIDKSKAFKTKKGEECIYIDVWVNDELDNYGNIAAVKQSDNYIGNLKDKKDEKEI